MSYVKYITPYINACTSTLYYILQEYDINIYKTFTYSMCSVYNK